MFDFIKDKKLGAALGIAIVATVIGLLSGYITKSPDGPIEQLAEEVIELELHLPKGSIDLSPGDKVKIEAEVKN